MVNRRLVALMAAFILTQCATKVEDMASRWHSIQLTAMEQEAGWLHQYLLQVPGRNYWVSIGAVGGRQKVAIVAMDTKLQRYVQANWIEGTTELSSSEFRFGTPALYELVINQLHGLPPDVIKLVHKVPV